MPSADYIPARDADLATWATNFSTLITAHPATFGLLSTDATAIASVVSSFSTALGVATSPSTRTPTTVSAKDSAKVALLAVVRNYAQQIALNAGVSSDDKVSLGINPRTSTPTPIAAPSSYPVLSIDFATPLAHRVRFRDVDAPDTSRGKPSGVTGLELRCGTSVNPITDQSLIPYSAFLTRAPFTQEFEAGDAGKPAYYAARWLNAKGEHGPWSPIVSMHVANAA